MTSHNPILSKDLYVAGSRTLTHVLFWLAYYGVFSMLWANNGNYYASFGLELILMPIRMTVAYLVMYVLMPRFLLESKLVQFIGWFLGTLLLAGILQRLLIYFYYELFFETEKSDLWEIAGIVRAMVLINSTALLLGAVKMYKYWRIEQEKNLKEGQELVEIRAEKRTYRINPNEILYVEGLGNYVTYYLNNRKPLISYSSLKEVENELPANFERIHKSFVANKDWIESYTTENVEIQGRILPLGKSVTIEFH